MNDLADQVKIKSFVDATALVNSFRKGENFDLIIMDVDLGIGKKSGFEASEDLRSLGFKGKICIHSNRGSLEFQPMAIKSGADMFLPKPMTRSNLSEVMLASLPTEHSGKVIVFEDESIYQRMWKKKLRNDVIVLKSWEEFLRFWEDGPRLDGIRYVITDYYLLNSETGLDIALNLKDKGFTGPIFLSSNLAASEIESAKEFDLIVPKKAEDALQEILAYLDSIKAGHRGKRRNKKETTSS